MFLHQITTTQLLHCQRTLRGINKAWSNVPVNNFTSRVFRTVNDLLICVLFDVKSVTQIKESLCFKSVQLYLIELCFPG